MNLIDFYVKEIVNEEYDVLYKLYGKSEEYLEEQRVKDNDWYKHLISNGCKQTYKYVDEGGEREDVEFFNLDRGHKPYKVGHKGLH